MSKLYSLQSARIWVIMLLTGIGFTGLQAQSVSQLTNVAGNPIPVPQNVQGNTIRNVNGTLYFAALTYTPGYGNYYQPFRSDGTPASTKRLANIEVSMSSADFIEYKGKVYFFGSGAGNALCVSDGTQDNIAAVKGFSVPITSRLLVANDKLFFLAPVSGSSPLTIWISDGTPAGTQPLADVVGVPIGGANPTELTAVGNKLFYKANADGGPGIWVTDGTAGGTRMVRGGPSSPGAFTPYFPVGPSFLAKMGDKLLFRASGDNKEDEPWVSDGTTEGTFSLDVQTGVMGSFPDIAPGSPTYSDRFFFTTGAGNRGLYSTDGTVAGTHLIKPLVNQAKNFTLFNGKLYFTDFNNSLWETDGSESGTRVMAGAPGGARNLTVTGGKLYFTVAAGGGNPGDALWVSDGTAAGTRRVLEPNGILDSRTKSLLAFNDQLYLTALPVSSSTTPELFRLNANQAPIAPAISDATGTVGQYFNQVIPAFTDPDGSILVYTVTGLPANLIFSGGAGGIIGGLPTESGVFQVTVTATDRGGLSASATYTLTIQSSGTPPLSATSLQLLPPTYNCLTGFIEFHTSGGDGSPISYVAPGIKRASAIDNFGVVEAELRGDPKQIVLQATQNGTIVSYTFDLPGACNGNGQNPPQPLQLLPPTYDCVTGVIKFRTNGGDGSL
ncbi:putative Ig domain-containing protein, partial [Spirosoma sp.]|uniref:putative Ig domain-containing protein n=1 Tax=Spirosoma sp. TaxID=1899569 RepID=UPI003B3BB518